MRKYSAGIAALAVLFALSFGMGAVAHADDGGDGVSAKTIGAASSAYVVFSWNDLGMHCMNPTYDKAVILPPYNNLYVQVVKRGNPPMIVNSGISVSYSIAGNTYTYGKRSYGQFWDNMMELFGISLPKNKGLNLTDPTVNNGLSGKMLAKPDYYVANGIPVSPVSDKGAWNPYQVANITVKNSSGTVIARTQATIPVSDEISCSKCHGADPFDDILTKHDAMHGTDLMNSKPVICAGCHGDPILGQTDTGAAGIYLSAAIHSSHADRGAACYDCHPGDKTQCSRSLAHTAPDGNCTTCHGQMSDVGGSILNGTRTPWAGEPKCYTCHNVASQVDTGDALYRNSRGHGNMFCSACHGSPHAMVPTSKASDNYQAIQDQSAAYTIGDCRVCHQTSRGGGSASEFAEEHGGSNKSACNVCHTGYKSARDTTKWPHNFLWKSR